MLAKENAEDVDKELEMTKSNRYISLNIWEIFLTKDAKYDTETGTSIG